MITNKQAKQALIEANEVLAVVRKTNDKQVEMLKRLKIVDLNLAIAGAHLQSDTDRKVIQVFGENIQREIESMQNMIDEMLKDRPKLKEAMKVLDEYVEENYND